MFKKLLSLLLLMWLVLALPISALGTTYYVSSSDGDDANEGTSEATPWQTIDKANSVKFAENSTLLFKRGDVFRGAISTKGYVIGTTIGAYGTGENPIIAGSVEISGWTKTTNLALGSDVYEADVSALPLTDKGIEHLFVNGELMTIARYPNVDSPADKNWLKVGASAGTDAFTDPVLADYGKPNDYWIGAMLRIRTYSWYYKVFEVTDYAAADGKITAAGLGGQKPEWGYFLDGKLEELDHPGEWYYDAVAQKVYLYPKNGANPNNLLVEGSTYSRGVSVYWQEHDTTVENLTFRHFIIAGVRINTSDNVIVRNCHFEYNTVGVAPEWKTANVLVSGNTFNHQLNTAITFNAPTSFDVAGSTLENNQITDTGMFPLYCSRYKGTCYGMGINVFGKGVTVRQNIIENTGWNGINLKAGGHHIIENNVVRNALSLLNDGGAITIGSDGNIIRGNFLFNTIGNVDESNGCGTTNNTPCFKHPSYGMGIGADSKFTENVIEDNTIANNAHQGVRLNKFTNTTVRNNVIYNNAKNQIVIEGNASESANNIVEGNLIYTLTPDQMGISLAGTVEHGTFDNNVYCNPYSEVVLKRDGKKYSLAHWQDEFPAYDQNSKWCGLRSEEYTVSNVGANLILNSTFDADVSNWGGNISFDANNPDMDGGSLKAVHPGTGSLNVSPQSFGLAENQLYRLKFSVIGNGFGTIRLRTNDTTPGESWKILKESYFAYDQNRKDYEMFFLSPLTTDYAKPLFTTKDYDADTYWLDNATFELVDAVLNDATQKSVLFSNTTENAQTISLENKIYLDLDGNTVTGSITLEPFSSQILSFSHLLSKLRFSADNYSVGEGEGSAIITVKRTGGNDGAVSVDYAMTDDTAVAGDDYTAVSDTLNWDDGDAAPKTFSVNIIDDSTVEGDEALYLSLGNVTGTAVLGTPNTAMLTITDNDTESSERIKNDVIIDFGPSIGLYARLNNNSWASIHDLSAKHLVTGDLDGNGLDEIIIDFDTYGLYVWMNNSSWVSLHSLSAKSMVTGDIDGSKQDDVIIDFGSGIGIWVWMNNSSWVKVHNLSADSLVTGDIDGSGQDDVIIDFGTDIGIWAWMNNSSWTKMHGLSAKSMVTGDMDASGQDDVVIDFGSDIGLYLWMNNSQWAGLHSLSAKSMVTGDIDGNQKDDVIIDFDTYGIYVRMNNSSWAALHGLSAENMATGDLDANGLDDVIIDFGSPYGIYVRMNNSDWTQLHSLPAQHLVTGNIDGLASFSTVRKAARLADEVSNDWGLAVPIDRVPLPESVDITLPPPKAGFGQNGL